MIKTYTEFINELYVIPSSISGSGRTKSQHLVYDDPTSDKSLSSGVLLNKKLKDEEFFTDITDLQYSPKVGGKSDRLSVLLNNLDVSLYELEITFELIRKEE